MSSFMRSKSRLLEGRNAARRSSGVEQQTAPKSLVDVTNTRSPSAPPKAVSAAVTGPAGVTAGDEADAEIKRLAAALAAARGDLASTTAGRDALASDHNALQETHSALVAELKELAGARDALASKHAAMADAHEALIAEHRTMTKVHDTLVVEHTAVGKVRDALTAERDALLVRHRELAKEYEAREMLVKDLGEALAAEKSALAAAEASVARADAQAAAHQANVVDARATAAEAAAKTALVEARYSNVAHELFDLQAIADKKKKGPNKLFGVARMLLCAAIGATVAGLAGSHRH
jgi:chromosome segregation ATPase